MWSIHDFSETTIVIAAVILCLAAVGIFRAIKPSREGGETLTILALFATAAVAVLQWRTLEKTDETLKAQQRAWIEPGPPVPLGIADDRINLLIQYRNIGNEPAINAVIQLDEPLLVVDPPRNGNWYERLPGRNPVCKRAVPNSAGIVIYRSSPPEKFRARIYPNQVIPDAEKVLAQSKILVIEGCIGYQTVEKAYYAAFCYYLTAVPGKVPQEWGVTQCQTRNEAF